MFLGNHAERPLWRLWADSDGGLTPVYGAEEAAAAVCVRRVVYRTYREGAAGHAVLKDVVYFKNDNQAHRVLRYTLVLTPSALPQPFRFLYPCFLCPALAKECEELV